MLGPPLFADRQSAGRALATALQHLSGRDGLIVLGLPRGGVAVAAEVAGALRVPLDVAVVRKLGTPGREELALGAIALGGVTILNDEVIGQLAIPRSTVEAIVTRERAELQRRERAYREGRPPLVLRGAIAVLVDDGLATGATMLAAVAAVRTQQPARIVVAVPVAAAETVRLVAAAAGDVVCLHTPWPFGGVGAWYADFAQLSDDAVRLYLAQRR